MSNSTIIVIEDTACAKCGCPIQKDTQATWYPLSGIYCRDCVPISEEPPAPAPSDHPLQGIVG